MNEKILEDIIKLKNDLKETEEYKNLLMNNKLLENSDEAKILSYKKDMAIMRYEDALRHFDKNSKEVLDAEKELGKTIYNLNHIEVVKEYNKSFNDYYEYYKEINKECFDFFKENRND